MQKSKDYKEMILNQKYQNMSNGKTTQQNENHGVHHDHKYTDKTENSTVKTRRQTLSDSMFDNIEKNKDRERHGFRYEQEFIDWCCTIKYGPKPYETLRCFLPFPDVKTLKKREESRMNIIKNGIDINGNTIEMLKSLLYDENSPIIGEKIKCILSIDAIEIALFKKTLSVIKNLILFYLIPLNSKIKPFCIKVLKHQNGKVNPDTLNIIKLKVNELFSNDSPVAFQYLSTDGDSGYNPVYNDAFIKLYLYIKTNGIDELFEFIQNLKNQYAVIGFCLIIGDMIHFMKNRRTQINFSEIKMKNVTVSVDDLYDILGNNAINDKSTLSKLQDTFPLEIFNFQVLASVFLNGNFDLIFFLFPLCCWNEAYNNQIIGKNTRLFLLECYIYGFKKIYELQKKDKNRKMIMPRIAIKRALVTVSIVYAEFEASTGVFNFAQYGTMLQEHFHALIRGMAQGVDTLDNTMNCIEKSNIIFNIQSRQETNTIKRTRYSVEGTHYDPNIYTNEFGGNLNSFYVIERLEKMSVFGNYLDIKDDFYINLYSFIDSVGKGSLRFTREDKNFRQGRNILAREITNAKELKDMMAREDLTDLQNKMNLI